VDATAIGRSASDRTAHVDILDGLRGIAIAFVMWFHVWEITWQGAAFTVFGREIDFTFLARMGFVGVEIFFFVSGFCLFWPYARALAERRPMPTVKHFAYRRFIKIVPSYLLALRFIKIVPSYLLALAVLVALGSERDRSLDDGIKDVLAHVFFVHTWFQSYFGSIDGVLWSLGVEVQFYVIFPLVVLAFVRWPRATALGLVALAFVWRYAVEQCCATGPYNHFHQLANQLPAYLDLFAIGMFAAWIVAVVLPSVTFTQRVRVIGTLVALAGCAWVVGLIGNVDSVRGMHDYAEHWQVWNRFPFGVALLVVTVGSVAAFPLWHRLQVWNRFPFGVALLVVTVGSVAAFPLWHRLFANRVLVFLSVISYNAYIWHQLVARGLLWLKIPPIATTDPHNDPHWQLLALPIYLLAGVAVASVLTYAFERPLLRFRWNGARGSAARAIEL